jgi:hypothetical protein
MALTVIFGAVILAFTVPARLPIISKRQLSPALWRALIALTISSLLQMIFNVCVGTGLLLLENSLRFAAVGAPCCVMALVLAQNDPQKAREYYRVLLGAILGLFMWLFFITLH